MSLAARLADLAAPAPEPRVLVVDIETSPHLAWTFELFDARINPDMVVEPSRMLCWAAKWAGTRRVMSGSEFHDGQFEMVSRLRDLLDEADAVAGYNSVSFDERHIRREILLAGLAPPSPWQSIDLLRTMRSQFKFHSNRLGVVGPELAVGAKVATAGWPLWKAVLDNESAAWDRLVRYNKGDVRLTEALLWAVLPYVKSLPHRGLWSGERACCYACGSTDLVPTGWIATRATIYPKVQCKECGSWSKVLKGGRTAKA